MEKLPKDNFTSSLHMGEDFNMPLHYLTATTITGDEVYDCNRQYVGKIKDIMLDVKSGNIHYYVVSRGGFLGIGARLFAIPFDLMKVDENKRVFIFMQPIGSIVKAPGFNRWHWPDTNCHLVVVGGMYDNV